jgi:hypothetical protein
MNDKLKFQTGNKKLNKDISFLNLPAGYTCPAAEKCRSKFNPNTSKIEDGPKIEFRCFGAMEERYPSVRATRWHNKELLQTASTLENMVKLITESLPLTHFIRPHASAGDFYNQTYFLAWLNVAINNPTQTFYTYTKQLPFLIKYRDSMPSNYNIVASFGGKHDHLIAKHGLQYAKVVNTVD